ncbi:MAG: aldo/keto reductase [Nitrospinota bacterium]|nr:aldo/keto reductase [Nitrospinota bacterium]
MDKRIIGGSDGIEISLVGLGCNAFGNRIDETSTHQVIESAIESGINFMDTAESYGDTRSETFMGTGLKGKRNQVFIATKFGFTKSNVVGKNRGSVENIRASVEMSLRRLKTDWIDLYQLHRPDDQTPIVETMSALDDLVKEGKIRFYGCSYFSGDQLLNAVKESKREGLMGFITAQNAWNVLERDIEEYLIPVCNSENIPILPYFPIAKGLLTGKYKRGIDAPSGSRLSGNKDLENVDFDILENLESYAENHGYDLLTLAISWLASQSVTASVIAGASRPEQCISNTAAARWKMTSQNLSEIDAIVSPENK